ncbi:MAG: hypothetical protein JRD05_12980 [Deltaproteobacteria bacterium]|nr:hypothetical protein [Deltaproteobacteria bacterium]
MKNPMAALSDLFSKLIIEHGSAVIQEKQIALFKDELTILSTKFADSNSRIEKLESENQNLKAEREKLTKRIQIYEHENKPFFHNNLLWLPNDEHPYCPTCHDSKNKLIHMLPWDSPYDAGGGIIHTKPALKCPKCNHESEIIKHPKL